MPKLTMYDNIALHACGDPKCNCLKFRFTHEVRSAEVSSIECDAVQASVEFDELPSLAVAIMEHYKSHGGKTQ